MNTNGAKQLVDGHDGLYVTVSNPDGSYELYRCRLDHVAQFRRKWQAVKHATDPDLSAGQGLSA